MHKSLLSFLGASLIMSGLLVGTLAVHAEDVLPTTITFPDPSDLQHWSVVNGSWTVENGEAIAKPIWEPGQYGHIYAFYKDADFTNVELQADVLVKAGNYHHPALMVRGLDANHHYICRVNEWVSQPIDGLQLYVKNNPASGGWPVVDKYWTHLDSNQWSWMDPQHTSMQEETWYTMKLRAEGNDVKCKMWDRSQPEPATWALQKTDSTLSRGMVGLESYMGEHHFDNVIIRPLPTITPPEPKPLPEPMIETPIEQEPASVPVRNTPATQPSTTNGIAEQPAVPAPQPTILPRPVERPTFVAAARIKKVGSGKYRVVAQYDAETMSGRERNTALAYYNQRTRTWVAVPTTLYQESEVAKGTVKKMAPYMLVDFGRRQTKSQIRAD